MSLPRVLVPGRTYMITSRCSERRFFLGLDRETSYAFIALAAQKSGVTVTDGTVWCWGNNKFGQLGNGSTTDSLVPVEVHGITSAVAISTDFSGSPYFAYACAVLRDGTVQSGATARWEIARPPGRPCPFQSARIRDSRSTESP
jgi:alpha-tubulin suppressor-like RCC1 family protein